MNKAFISCRVNAALDDRSGAREQNSSSAPQERQKEREREIEEGGKKERERPPVPYYQFIQERLKT